MYLTTSSYSFTISIVFFCIIYLVIISFFLVLTTLNRNFLLTLLFFDLIALNIILIFIITPLVNNCALSYGCALTLMVTSACDLVIGLGLYILIYKATNEVSLISSKVENSKIIYDIKYYNKVRRIMKFCKKLGVFLFVIFAIIVDDYFFTIILGGKTILYSPYKIFLFFLNIF